MTRALALIGFCVCLAARPMSRTLDTSLGDRSPYGPITIGQEADQLGGATGTWGTLGSGCGDCDPASSEACDEAQEPDPCHWWSEFSPITVRGGDSHFQWEDWEPYEWIGGGLCSHDHNEDCENRLDVMALRDAVRRQDVRGMLKLVENGGRTWFEFNERREAVQAFAFCLGQT